MFPKVVKRDGATEKFSLINIAKVGTASGLTPEQSKALAEKIASWATNLHVEQITSLQIRDKMLEELPQINTNAAEMYKWYESTKEM